MYYYLVAVKTAMLHYINYCYFITSYRETGMYRRTFHSLYYFITEIRSASPAASTGCYLSNYLYCSVCTKDGLQLMPKCPPLSQLPSNWE